MSISAIEKMKRRRKNTCDDDEMLQELDVLQPKVIHEKIDRKLLRTIIGTKRNFGWGIEWSNELADELHKPIRKKFKKKSVCFRYRCNMDC